MVMCTLVGNTPSKKNSKRVYAVKGRSYPVVLPSAIYTKWHKINMKRLPDCISYPGKGENDKILSFPLPSKVRISVKFYRDSLRRWDYSNALESVQDILVDAGILTDDSAEELCIGAITHDIDRENPRAEVVLEYGLKSGICDSLMDGIKHLSEDEKDESA